MPNCSQHFQPQENKSCPFSLLKSSKIVVKMNISLIFETKLFLCIKTKLKGMF